MRLHMFLKTTITFAVVIADMTFVNCRVPWGLLFIISILVQVTLFMSVPITFARKFFVANFTRKAFSLQVAFFVYFQTLIARELLVTYFTNKSTCFWYMFIIHMNFQQNFRFANVPAVQEVAFELLIATHVIGLVDS